ncbi:MAG: hypothetical protein R2788_01925 [Saprospiraceae bacterium]
MNTATTSCQITILDDTPTNKWFARQYPDVVDANGNERFRQHWYRQIPLMNRSATETSPHEF